MIRKTLLAATLVSLVIIQDATAQYRANDEFHAGHQKYDDPARRSPNGSASVDFGDGQIVIEYGSPYVNDRELYGRLIPSGSVWRTGANEATVIHFDNDVLVQGQRLEAGNYALFTIGSAEQWTFIFNSVQYQWGAFSHDPSKDVLRVTATPNENEKSIEQLTFSFSQTDNSAATMKLSWGTIRVKLDFELADG